MNRPLSPFIGILLLVGVLGIQKENCYAQSTTLFEQQITIGYDSLNADKYGSALSIFKQLSNNHESNTSSSIRCRINIGIAIADYFESGKTLSDPVIKNKLFEVPEYSDPESCNLLAAYYTLAGYAKRRKEYTMAIAYLDTAMFHAYNSLHPADTSILARAYSLKGQCHLKQNKFTEAANDYLEAKKLVQDYSKANQTHNYKYSQYIGTIYAALKEYDQAILFFQEALMVKAKYDLPTSENDIIINNNMGNVYFDQKEFNKAAEKIDEAIRLTLQLYGKENKFLGNSYLNQGNIYVQSADFSKAREYYLKALSLESIRETKLQILYNNIGYTYFRQKEYEKAIEYYNKAINNNKSIIEISTMRNIAQCYHGIGKIDVAESLFKNALDISKKSIHSINIEYALSLQDYGRFLIETDRPDIGINMLNMSLDMLKQQSINKRDNEAVIHRILANYHADNKDYKTALFHVQNALIALEPEFTSSSVEDNPNIVQSESPYELLGILSLKADVLHKFGKTEDSITYILKAHEIYALTSTIFDNLKKTYSYDESKLFISGQINGIFQKAVNVAYDLYSLTNNPEYLNSAFFFTEKNKYSTLLEAYRESVLRSQTIPAVDLETLTYFQKKLEKADHALYNAQKETPVNQQKNDSLNELVFDLNRKKDSLETELKTTYPEFILANKTSNLINPQSIQKKLSKNQVLIEYSLQDSIVYAFCISHNKFIVEKININTSYIDSLSLSMNDTGLANYSINDYRTFITASYYLHDKLISLFTDNIQNKSLIIIPDSKLGYVPFEALITQLPSTEKMDFRKPDYLIRHHSISYSYSSTLLFEADNSKRDLKKTCILAVAPEYFYGENNYTGDTLLNQLAPIPGVSEEISTICKIFNCTALKGEYATEETFKELAPDYEILHLAMHTLIDAQNPSYSRLVFSYPENDSVADDGVLYTSELFTLSLQSRMAVLSACQTGDGAIHEGEGILSLARGFFYAGVPSVVMTLWSVDDTKSAEIMGSFYRYLKKGHSKDKALQQAKIDLLDTNDPVGAHPRFWAGYVTIGDQSPIRKSSLPYTLSGVFLLLLAGFFTIKKLRG